MREEVSLFDLSLMFGIDHSPCLKTGDSWAISSTEEKWTQLKPPVQRQGFSSLHSEYFWLRLHPDHDVHRSGGKSIPLNSNSLLPCSESTGRTKLTGWKGFTHLDNGSSIPFGLVLQHLSKFRPGSIRNGLGQLMFFYHSLHIQVFQANHLVFANEPGRQPVKEILTGIFDFFVNPGYYYSSCLVPVTASNPGRRTNFEPGSISFLSFVSMNPNHYQKSTGRLDWT
jgi:hypothetical protein